MCLEIDERERSCIVLGVLPFVHWTESIDIKQHAVSYNSFVHTVIDLTLTAYLISLLGQACMEGGGGRCTVAPAE